MRKIATIILGLGSITGVIQAETHAVLAGGSIQAKIDLAVDGDIVAIFGGTYNQDITITKRIRLVEINGQDVTISGSVTFSSVADCPPFEGFTVGSNRNKDITVIDTTGLVISGIDHTAGSNITVDETSDIELKDSELHSVSILGAGTIHNITTTGSITFNGSKLVFSGSTIGGDVSQGSGELHISEVIINGSFNTGNDAAKTVAFRTTVTGDCNWRSKLAWFGYGKARSFNFEGGDAKVVFVGGEIDRLGSEADGMLIRGSNNSVLVCNSVIKGTTSHAQGNDANIDIDGDGHVIRIFNNYLDKTWHNGGWGNAYGDFVNVWAGDNVTNLVVANNICKNTVDYMVRAPFGATVMNNHAINEAHSGVGGGVSSLNTTIGDPIFVDDNPRTLAPSSPLINTGTLDPRYNDRDGTRNDIGPSGGSWYDPEGWTTEKPVVISFDLLPDSVLEGVDTEVTIEGVRAVSKP
jgi:hypothetical protein